MIVASFGVIIPSEVFDLPKYGFLNIHPSLLPKYRGCSPISSTILSGDKMSGITFARIEEKVDAGNILFQESIKVSDDETSVSLTDKLAHLASRNIYRWQRG